MSVYRIRPSRYCRPWRFHYESQEIACLFTAATGIIARESTYEAAIPQTFAPMTYALKSTALSEDSLAIILPIQDPPDW